MDKNRITKLKDLLTNSETRDPAVVRKEAKEFLKTVDIEELVFAEQKLMEEGLSPDRLGGLCAAHLELMNEDLNNVANTLDESHPIKILMTEHDEILHYLDELDAILKILKEKDKYEDIDQEIFLSLKNITKKLVDTDKHYQREEESLFPATQENGLYGPPQIMAHEHIELRELKKAINDIANKLNGNNYSELTDDLNSNSKRLIQTLRDHIFKENTILFPSALKAIPDESWKKIKEDFDKIGY